MPQSKKSITVSTRKSNLVSKDLKQLPAKNAVTKKSKQKIVVNVRRSEGLGSVVTFITRSLKNAPTSPMPKDLRPMLATLTKTPFSDPDWVYEIKWDGYRCISYVNTDKVVMRSRNNLFFNNDYPEVYAALKNWRVNAVIDGEIIIFDEEGKPDFNALEKWTTTKTGTIFYYAFDIIWLDGFDLTFLPLIERKAILKKIVPENSIIRYSDYIEEAGTELYQLIKEQGLEGIIAKRKLSRYLVGKRSTSWLKIPTELRQSFVIGGWVESDKNRPFKTMLFGYYMEGKLHYYHHSGSGYTDKQMVDIYNVFKSMETKKNPFVNEIDYPGIKHWIEPKLVGEFKISKITKAGEIRHPAVWHGWREDIEPKTITVDEINEVL
jgi:bifunctional non-homologous end joining protein LigD